MNPSWLTGLKPVAQALAGALPALVIVIFAGILSLLALACEPERRSYALDYADRFTNLAAVLVGQQRQTESGDFAAPRPEL
jgi:hypothetical protein